MTGDPFQRRARAWVIGVVAVSFAFGLVLMVFGGELADVPSAGADTYSRSAIGHKAFGRLLRELDVPVFVSRHDSGARAGSTALLVIAEPRLASEADPRADALRELMRSAEHVLLVLPKWTGVPAKPRPTWLRNAEPVPLEAVNAVLRVAGISAEVVRPARRPTWRRSAIPGVPHLDSPQLVSGVLDAIVGSDAGVLLGAAERPLGGRLYVLSDPDLLANHGLGRGDNAVVVAGAIDLARDGDRPVVIDETIHGFEVEPSIWRDLFEFPMALATIHVASVLAVLLWASMGRFGAPAAAPRPIQPGKRSLIDNTAALLQLGGHSPYSLVRYWRAAVQDAGRLLRAPRELDRAALLAWLQRISSARGSTADLVAIDSQVAAASAGARAADVVALAETIHRWSEELRDGPSGYSGRR